MVVVKGLYNMGNFLPRPFDGCKKRIYNMGGFLQLPFGGCTPVFFTTTNWWLCRVNLQQPLGCCKHVKIPCCKIVTLYNDHLLVVILQQPFVGCKPEIYNRHVVVVNQVVVVNLCFTTIKWWL